MLEFGGYDWLAFTSANGVHHFFADFFRIFDDIQLAGAGSHRLRRQTRRPRRMSTTPAAGQGRGPASPKKATAEALADEMIATGSMDSAKVALSSRAT